MKNRLLHGISALALCAALCLGSLPAKAENCFVINVDLLDMNSLRDNDYIAQYLSAGAAGIRVQKYISDSDELAARVRLTILQGSTNTLVFDKNYGYQSGTFDSGDIYLPYADNSATPYLVTLYIEDWVYAMPFMHLMPRLSQNGACTFGVRMRDLNPALTSDWLMGTMLDLNALRIQGSMVVPICASNAYLIGEATIMLDNDQLTVQLALASSANVELHRYSIYCISQVSELTTAEPGLMPQPSYSLGESIDVSGASSVLLYMPMVLSYDSGGLSPFFYDLNSADLQFQLALWTENLIQTEVPAFDSPFGEETPTIEIIPEAETSPDLYEPDPEPVFEFDPASDEFPAEPVHDITPAFEPDSEIEIWSEPQFEAEPEVQPEIDFEAQLEAEPQFEMGPEFEPSEDESVIAP